MNEFYGRSEASGGAEQLITFCIYPLVTDSLCRADSNAPLYRDRGESFKEMSLVGLAKPTKV
jgi:hypothetical protein